MEDQEERLLLAKLLLSVNLVLVQELGVELDVTRLVNTVDVTESGGNAEVGANLGEGIVDIPDILGVSVKLGVIDASVIDTIFLTTSDTDLHIEPEARGAMRLKYSTQMAMFFSLGSSERSNMWEENRASPCSLK